jgi:hypothetical protein
MNTWFQPCKERGFGNQVHVLIEAKALFTKRSDVMAVMFIFVVYVRAPVRSNNPIHWVEGLYLLPR